MASYLEIKQCLRDILAINADIDETCDIVWQVSSYFDEDIERPKEEYILLLFRRC